MKHKQFIWLSLLARYIAYTHCPGSHLRPDIVGPPLISALRGTE